MNKYSLLITRPVPFALSLAKKVEQNGGLAIITPSIGIYQVACSIKIEQQSVVIFTSQPAVENFLAQIKNNQKLVSTVIQAKLLCIGNSTAKYLEQSLHSLQSNLFTNLQTHLNIDTNGSNSETLLQHGWLNTNLVTAENKYLTVTLITGKKGLDKIKTRLEKNNRVNLNVLEVYERRFLPIDQDKIKQFLAGQETIHPHKKFVLSTSRTILQALKTGISSEQWAQLCKLNLIVFSKGIKIIALELGWLGKIYQTTLPSNLAIINCIKEKHIS